MRRLNLTGQQFGRLRVIDRAANRGKHTQWNCLCDCGESTSVSTTHLRSGHTMSCGCIALDELIARNSATASIGDRPAEHEIWRGMVRRCLMPSTAGFERYGGRGISVCDKWRASFDAFIADVGPRPSPAHSLDRIDNSKGYEPGNVRWATDVVQNNNKRNNVRAVVNGVSMTAAEISREFGIPHSTVLYRIRRGNEAVVA